MKITTVTRNGHVITYHRLTTLSREGMAEYLFDRFPFFSDDSDRYASTGGTFHVTTRGVVTEYSVSICPDYRRALHRRADTGWLDFQGRITFKGDSHA